MRQGHRPAPDGVLHLGHHQPLAELGDAPIAELDDLREVVAGVDVQEGERQLLGPEGLQREMQHDAGVLAGGEQQSRLFEFGGDLAQNVDGFGFQPVEMGLVQGANGHITAVSHYGGSTARETARLLGALPLCNAGHYIVAALIHHRLQ